MLGRIGTVFYSAIRNQIMHCDSKEKGTENRKWFSSVEENTVHWDRREFLEEPFVLFLIKNKTITFSDLNTMKRNDLQKLDLAFELGLFTGPSSMTKEEVLLLKLDDLMRLKSPLSNESGLLCLPTDFSLDLMQRECLQNSLSVQKLLEGGSLTQSDVALFDVEDFAKFDYESVVQLFLDGALTLDQIKSCSVFECKKFEVKIIQEILRSGELPLEQILWSLYRRAILGIETKVELN